MKNNWLNQVLGLFLSVALFSLVSCESEDPPERDQNPDLEAEGVIAFTSARDGNNEIYVMNADGSGQTRLTDHSALDMSPEWSPDGRKIAFMSYRNGDSDIFVMNSDGTDPVCLTPDAPGYARRSPDGRPMVARRSPEGRPMVARRIMGRSRATGYNGYNSWHR